MGTAETTKSLELPKLFCSTCMKAQSPADSPNDNAHNCYCHEPVSVLAQNTAVAGNNNVASEHPFQYIENGNRHQTINACGNASGTEIHPKQQPLHDCIPIAEHAFDTMNNSSINEPGKPRRCPIETDKSLILQRFLDNQDGCFQWPTQHPVYTHQNSDKAASSDGSMHVHISSGSERSSKSSGNPVRTV